MKEVKVCQYVLKEGNSHHECLQELRIIPHVCFDLLSSFMFLVKLPSVCALFAPSLYHYMSFFEIVGIRFEILCLPIRFLPTVTTSPQYPAQCLLGSESQLHELQQGISAYSKTQDKGSALCLGIEQRCKNPCDMFSSLGSRSKLKMSNKEICQEGSWDQYLLKGNEKSRTGQKEAVGHDTVSTEASAHPTVGSKAARVLHRSPKLSDRAVPFLLMWISHRTQCPWESSSLQPRYLPKMLPKALPK